MSLIHVNGRYLHLSKIITNEINEYYPQLLRRSLIKNMKYIFFEKIHLINTLLKNVANKDSN